MVFYNTKYRNKAVAMEMSDGLVVLATLYEVCALPNFDNFKIAHSSNNLFRLLFSALGLAA